MKWTTSANHSSAASENARAAGADHAWAGGGGSISAARDGSSSEGSRLKTKSQKTRMSFRTPSLAGGLKCDEHGMYRNASDTESMAASRALSAPSFCFSLAWVSREGGDLLQLFTAVTQHGHDFPRCSVQYISGFVR